MLVLNISKLNIYLMLTRRKQLLKVLSLFPNDKIIYRKYLMKVLFLIKQEYNPDKFYSFHPYLYGPFSIEVYKDIEYLMNEGYLNQELKVIKPEKVKINYESYVSSLLKKFKTADEITQYVYSNYSNYIPKEINNSKGIVNVGYEGESIDSFLDKLIQNNVNVLVDVRANPFSMKFDFIGSKLKDYLNKVNIKYIQIKELGIESEDRKGDRKQVLNRYYKTLETKESYLQKLINLSKTHKIALMCFEKDVNECHRGEISKYLTKKGLKVETL